MQQLQAAEIQVSYKPGVRIMPIIKTSKDAYDVLKDYFNEETICL